MRSALSHEFKAAIPAYDEKPRTKWIFDYSVQNTIMVSRTFFTQDVNEAFEELEEGNEDALKVRDHFAVFSQCSHISCASSPEWHLHVDQSGSSCKQTITTGSGAYLLYC